MKYVAIFFLAAAALAVSAAALATAAPPVVTKFERGDQIVTIMSGNATTITAKSLMNQKVDGQTRRRSSRSVLGGPSSGTYWVRVREIDGRLQCEKFAILMDFFGKRFTEQDVAIRAEELFRAACS